MTIIGCVILFAAALAPWRETVWLCAIGLMRKAIEYVTAAKEGK